MSDYQQGASPAPDRSDLLDEQVIWAKGSLMEVVRHWRGWHPQVGQLHWGWSGKETIEQAVVVRPTHVFTVLPPVPDLGQPVP